MPPTYALDAELDMEMGTAEAFPAVPNRSDGSDQRGVTAEPGRGSSGLTLTGAAASRPQTTNSPAAVPGDYYRPPGTGLIYVWNTFANTGEISLSAGVEGAASALLIGQPDQSYGGMYPTATTLTGGGQILMSDNSGNSIGPDLDGHFGGMLTNVDNTISGAGIIETSGLVNDAAGLIDATGTNNALRLEIDQTGTEIVNAGLIEATGAAGLTIDSTIIDNSRGGTLLAGAGSVVRLINADVIGGGLKTVKTGFFQLTGVDTFDGRGKAANNTGLIDVGAASRLTLEGAFRNTGTVALDGGNVGVQIAANTTLSGGGAVTLGAAGGNSIQAYAYRQAIHPTLTNIDNTLSGAGVIGRDGSQLTLVNQAKGVIDANSANGLTIETDSNTLTNSGLIEASGVGGLTIEYTSVDDSKGGIILAGAGATVTLTNDQMIGGTLSATGTGVFQASQTTLDGRASAVNIAGPVDVGASSRLTLEGAIRNAGALALDGGNVGLLIGADTTLSGGGAVDLTVVYGGGVIQTNGVDATLTNVDNTVSGAGTIGRDSSRLTLVNQAKGVIDASTANGLTLETDSNVITNAGLIEATGAGGLTIAYSSVSGVGGTIFAGAGSTVTLQSAKVTGGRLATAAGGTISIGSGSSATADGTFANAGTIALASAASLILDKATTLTGGGSVTLNGADLEGTSTSVVLSNVDNTIIGAGLLGGGALTLINEAAGVIDASGTAALEINTGRKNLMNAGLIESAGAGGGLIDGAVANTGLLEANGGNLTVKGAVSGAGSAVVNGGTLDFAASFSENVAFTSKTGTLELARSQAYKGSVSGFSLSGGTALDLRDIEFVGASEATFSGTKTSGTLTVSDGTHTAYIKLTGNYKGSTFTAMSDGDGDGGTMIVGSAAAESPSPRFFVAAMASFGAGAGATAGQPTAHTAHPSQTLFSPRAQIA